MYVDDIDWVLQKTLGSGVSDHRPGENHSMCKGTWVGVKATAKAFWEEESLFLLSFD